MLDTCSAPAYAASVRYRCSRCHAVLDSEAGAPPSSCPACRAEIGFERIGPVPLAARLFGMLLAGVIIASTVAGLVSRLAG